MNYGLVYIHLYMEWRSNIPVTKVAQGKEPNVVQQFLFEIPCFPPPSPFPPYMMNQGSASVQQTQTLYLHKFLYEGFTILDYCQHIHIW